VTAPSRWASGSSDRRYCEACSELVEAAFTVCDVERFRRNQSLADELANPRRGQPRQAQAVLPSACEWPALQELAEAAQVAFHELEALVVRVGARRVAEILVGMVRRRALAT